MRPNVLCVACPNLPLPAIWGGDIRRTVPSETHHPVNPSDRRQTGQSRRRCWRSGRSSGLRRRSRGNRGWQALHEGSHSLCLHRPQRQATETGRLQRAVMRDHPNNDGERAPGFHHRHRHERQAASPGERGRHRPHAPDLDPGELCIGTRLRRAQRQRVLRLIWPPARDDRARLHGARPLDSWTCGAFPGNVLGFSGKGIPNVNYEFRPDARQSRARRAT